MPVDFAVDRRIDPGLSVGLGVLLAFVLMFAAQSSDPRTAPVIGIAAALTVALAWLPGLLWLYRVEPGAIRVRGPGGWISIAAESVAQVEAVEFRVTLRTFGLGGLGALYGWFWVEPVGNVRVYGGKSSGQGVLLTLYTGEQILLTPKDLEGFLAYLRRLGYKVKPPA
ncbi:hypothetical protein Mesil_3040 [Allomeiothermus silvanus DSM 9946]|uniref:Bacterial Pleckstrin homology domain-containing protein n=1 Tax=Allomeiothermus silvanus (strain ATCC 700542 / DSM 9946 / NBRC 106475 / NCIMB 13440 / VI-R2) TaxID=526227 RepID=D7BE20_ALLS1|nr:hypothetical protein Mesil_3040 [Allomeiothermus silvanus DSM 9946]